MNPALFGLACWLLLLTAQGLPASVSRKCLCSWSYISAVNRSQISGEPEIYQPRSICPEVEIILTVNGVRKCVSPQSHLGRTILSNMRRRAFRTKRHMFTTRRYSKVPITPPRLTPTGLQTA